MATLLSEMIFVVIFETAATLLLSDAEMVMMTMMNHIMPLMGNDFRRLAGHLLRIPACPGRLRRPSTVS